MITGLMHSKKGDKSLEMIIGMLILLVVAGVVINLFLSKVNPGMLPTIDPVKEKRDQVLRECDALCGDARSGSSETAAFEYCKRQFSFDMTGDKIKDGAFKTPTAWMACESNFYCFLMEKCDLGEGQYLDAGACKRIMCNTYKQQYLSIPGTTDTDAAAYATSEVLALVKRGTCTFASDETGGTPLDWYEQIYATGCQ